MSVAEVAGAVGIPDFGYFSKLFKRHIGISPREYKKMLDK
jgi:two-component system response regulator YesN